MRRAVRAAAALALPLSVAATAVPARAGMPLDLSSNRGRMALDDRYRWQLTLANGDAVTMHTSPGSGGALQSGTSSWTRRGAPLTSRPVAFFNNGHGVTVEVGLDEQEQAAADRIRADTPAVDQLTAQLDAVLDRVNARCAAVPDNARAACSRPFEAEVEALNVRIGAARDETARRATAVSRVCGELRLQPAPDGRVSGTANRCAGLDGIAVTGTYTRLP